MKDFSGVYTALLTPFKNGAIDWSSLKRLIKFQLDGGINGLVVNGTTGESPVITAAEKKELFAFVKAEVAGQIPLVLGTGTNSTADTVAATQEAEKWGADGALVVVPYYNKPPQRGLFAHFQKVAESSRLPILLYNVPGRTITRLELQTIEELSQIKNIVGIKEATGDVPFGRQIVQECGPDFLVTSGDDATYLELIGVGAKGVISVASHFMPKQFVDWCNRARKGDTSAQEDLLKYRDLILYTMVEANPIPVKMAMHLMGVIDTPEMRLPLVPLAEPYTAELKKKMQAAGLV